MKDILWEIGETAHTLRRYYDRRVSAHGVTRSQWRVLARLERAPGLKQVELADLLDIEPITLSRIVDRLAAAGLVERVRDPDDRRAWRLELTSAAAPLMAELHEVADEVAAMALSGLGKTELETMRDTLAAIRANVAEEEGKSA
ncbi:MarR family winged helix-turn-helix transcriptional regulator [Sphingomicrobium aestuariivivum]|uniref:MarR family winged helix-turn-helix transcriptional regulator n=1 Tax=Sphingomicrobium aestuariivivum TaxID=1582356 RepID=UPI001FD64383|nr:MarR family transcriptional regulator [Sphingomicrobium aestuariivivum]MCJ8191929.1 MarR family transcriptional regulator [Sphingomicrobium aestuariivivum]